MLENEFSMAIREVGEGMFLDLKGDLTKQAEEMLLQFRDWTEGLEPGKRYLILNFTNVAYINSYGIAILIRLVRIGAKEGFQTMAYGLNSHYKKLLRMVGLTEYMSIHNDETEILQQILA